MTAYLHLLTELEAIRARRRRSEEDNTCAWLDQVAQIIRSASDELASDIDRYDARKARELDAELDARERARDMQQEAQTWERGE